MGTQEHPNSGYLIEASALIYALPAEHRRHATELLEDYDTEGLQELFENELPETFPRPEQTFQLGDEDFGDGMDTGLYVEFAEDELYTKTPKPCMEVFRQAISKTPERRNWTILG